MPKAFSSDQSIPFKTVGQLIADGARLPKLEELKWTKGQGKRQTAYLCYSSGTSGLPVCEANTISPKFSLERQLTLCFQKGVMISHRNVISNIMQFERAESMQRSGRPANEQTEVGLGLLPLSHIYGLVVIAHVGAYRGDEVIILPKFELPTFLNAIQTYKIEALYLVI